MGGACSGGREWVPLEGEGGVRENCAQEGVRIGVNCICHIVTLVPGLLLSHSWVSRMGPLV